MDPSWYGVPSPALAGGSPIYVTGEDGLRLTVFNSVAGVTVTLSGRFLPARQRSDEADPRVGVFNQTLVPATTRTASTIFMSLGEGWLLDWSAQVTAGAPLKGNTYAILELARGTTGTIARVSRLGEGYITSNVSIGWPGSTFQGMLDGEGAIRSITGTTPGAGAQISETVPTGARWELLAVLASLTTSAVVANRIAEWTIDDGANIFWRNGANVTQTASTTNKYIISEGFNQFNIDTSNDAARCLLNFTRITAGFRFRTLVAAMDAGDQWTAPQYLVKEWLEA